MDTAPGLATVLVGDDPASQIYVGGKHKACAEVGIASIRHDLPADTSEAELLDVVAQLNADPAVSGIIVQLPLPAHIDAARVDVGGRSGQGRRRAHADQRGAARAGPRRPRARDAVGRDGAAARLRHAARGRARGGRRPQRPGRQAGRRRCCSRRTRPSRRATRARATSRAVCRSADVLVAAVGRPRLITGDMVKEGATVIDVGMNRTDDGLVGDVDFESAVRPGAGDHAGAGRGGPDDHRDAAAEHAEGGCRWGPARIGNSDFP